LELVFDQGVGDIFVVRVAGNVCGTDEMGSIEYGVDHVGTPLLVILGHTQCGAVTAAATGAEVHGHIRPLVEKIAPAVSKAQAAHRDLHGKALVPAATEANVWHAAEELLKNSPAAQHRVQAGTLKLVGAIYDVRSGQVKWLGEHPQQSRLLGSKNQASTRPAGH
jgi:carbonic anhydrase